MPIPTPFPFRSPFHSFSAHAPGTVRRSRRAGPAPRALLALVPLLLSACASAPPPAPVGEAHAYVLLGEEGAAVARVVVDAPACPEIAIDGRGQPMRVRALPATLAQRPTASSPADSKPSVFPLLTCETVLPAGAASASVLGMALPLPRAEPRRIVVVGDSGCRLKRKDNEFQECNDPELFPFATVAAAAAAWKPDLVIHVGDYHYRENACPDGNAGCAGSPWGYGWDTWRADLFGPAAPLLRAAPWIAARGNHESCERAGQGWWRLLDTRPLLAGRDCDAPAADHVGDYSDPYAVPLGGGAQLLVMDTAATTWRGLKPGDTGYEKYRDTYRKLDALARRAAWNIGVAHHPILGVGAELKNGKLEWHKGDLGLQQSFGSLNPALLPSGMQAMISGHAHLWEQLSFATDHPSQFVAGISGSAEDTAPLPATLPPEAMPAAGVEVRHFSTWIGGFGFMALERMERDGPGEWRVTLHDRHGAVKNRCRVSGRSSVCELAQVQ
ncbi:metallophosphoesterase [Pseudoduganella namucuonensis]|uniref:Calcineurin-like phosphoesterase n=1 Tax=Pseudoduganella namucuonensis TaxID=1035707 RepID=A0A1I7M135_9BURK|nr:metallophosphoesterase [Pseudoduganella namucuonensis]SFV15682.1 Calcineurin-like phosphoesterase [Pseudoduganella namucuonensis]